MSTCYDLPEPTDYGMELEQQAARKAAREYEWSGRQEEMRSILLLRAEIAALRAREKQIQHALDRYYAPECREPHYIFHDIEDILEKPLTTAGSGV